MRRCPPSLLLALALTLGACAPLPIRSAWVAQPPPANGPDPAAAAPAALSQGDVDVWVSNDAQRLYLTLSTVTDHVKEQWLGVWGQSLLILLDPGDRHPDAQGLRLTLTPPSGLEPPWDPRKELSYLMASDDRLERVGLGDDGGLHDLPVTAQDADWELHFEGPRLVYRLSLPLARAQGWDLGLAPGRRLGLHVLTSPVEPHRAMAFREAHAPARWNPPSGGPKTGSGTAQAVSGTAQAGGGGPPDDSPRLSGDQMKHLSLEADLSNAQAARRGDYSGAMGQATRALQPYPAPNQVPDPVDIHAQVQLAPAPRP
jgi:hypothetical protein